MVGEGPDPTMLALKMEKKGPWTKDVGSFKKLEKVKKWILLQSSRKEHGSADILMLAQLDQFWTSDPWNCKMINLYCYEPQFVAICYSSEGRLMQVGKEPTL